MLMESRWNKGSLSSETTSFSFGLGKNDGLANTTATVTAGLGVGLNVSSSLSTQTQMLMDINGDGLPDIVEKEDGGYVKVRFNTGSGFKSDEEAVLIPLPSWDDCIKSLKNTLCDGNILGGVLKEVPIIGIAYNESTFNLGYLNHYLENTSEWKDELDCTMTVSNGLNGGINVGGTVHILVPIPLVPFTINISANANAGLNASCGVTSASVKMMDINGDGLVDQVLRVPETGTYVKLNQGAKVGLLQKIRLPQGGSYTLEYEEAGNTVAMPQYRNVLSKVTMSDDRAEAVDGCSSYVRQYSYEDGYYDRLRKDFYGFRTLKSWSGDKEFGVEPFGYRVVTFYNDMYYRK